MARRNSDFKFKDSYKVGNYDYSDDEIDKFIRETQEEEKRNEQKSRYLLYQQLKKKKASKQQDTVIPKDENTAVITKEVTISNNTTSANELKTAVRDVQEIVKDVKILLQKRDALIKQVIINNKQYGKTLFDVTDLSNKAVINENKINKEIEEINERQNEYINKVFHNTPEYEEYDKVYSRVTEIETEIKKDEQLYKDYKKNNNFVKTLEGIDSKITGKDKVRLNKAIKKLEESNKRFINFKNEIYNDSSIDETVRSLINLESATSFFKRGAGPIINKLKKESDEIDNKVKKLLSEYAIRNNMIDGIIRKSKNIDNRVIKNLYSDRNYMDKVLKSVVSDNLKLKSDIIKLEKKLDILNKKYTKTENTIERKNKSLEKLNSRIKKYYDEEESILAERNKILERYDSYITLNKSGGDEYLNSLMMSDDGMKSIKLHTSKYMIKKYGNFIRQHNEQIKNEILEYFFNHGGNDRMSVFCAYCSSHRLYYNEDTKKFEYYDKYGDTMGTFKNETIEISYNTTNPSQYHPGAYTLSTYGLIEMLDKGRKTFEINSGVNTQHNWFSNYATLHSGTNAAFGKKITGSDGLISFYSEDSVTVETTKGILKGIAIKAAVIYIVNKHARELNEEIQKFDSEIKNVDKKLKNITSIINNNKTVKSYKKTKDELHRLTDIDLNDIQNEKLKVANEITRKQSELNNLNAIIENIDIHSDSNLLYIKEIDNSQRPKVLDYNTLSKQYKNAKKKAEHASMNVTSLRRELKRNYNIGIVNGKSEIRNRITKNKTLLESYKKSSAMNNIITKYPQFKYYNETGYNELEKKKVELLKRKQSYTDSNKKHQNRIDEILRESLKGTVDDYEKIEYELSKLATELEKIDKKLDDTKNEFYKEHAKQIADVIKQDENKIKEIVKNENDKFAKEISSTVKCDIKLNIKEKKQRVKNQTKNKNVAVPDIVKSLGIAGNVSSNTKETKIEIMSMLTGKTFETEEDLKKFIEDRNKTAIYVKKRTKQVERMIKLSRYSDEKEIEKILEEIRNLSDKWGLQ